MQMKDQLTKDDFVVLIFHDHGSRYVGKIYNDEWMLERGFLDVHTVKDLIGGLGRRRLVTLELNSTVAEAMSLMKKYDIEQIPVLEKGEMKGSITQNGLFKKLMEDADIKNQKVSEVLEAAMPVVSMDTRVDRLTQFINKDNGGVLAKDESGDFHILTKYDIINAFSK
jgi:cystathionine beta-synthase